MTIEGLTSVRRTISNFNRGHLCAFRQIELRGLIEARHVFASHQAKVVSIMPAPQTSTEPLARDVDGQLMMLSHLDNAFELSIELVFRVADKVTDVMKARGFNVDHVHSGDGWMLPVLVTFMLDRGGRVIARKVNPDFRTH